MKKADMIVQVKKDLEAIDDVRVWVGRMHKRQAADNKTTRLVLKGEVKITVDDLKNIQKWIDDIHLVMLSFVRLREYHPIEMWERMFIIGGMNDLREMIVLRRHMRDFIKLIQTRPKQLVISRKENSHDKA